MFSTATATMIVTHMLIVLLTTAKLKLYKDEKPTNTNRILPAINAPYNVQSKNSKGVKTFLTYKTEINSSGGEEIRYESAIQKRVESKSL